MEGMKRIKLGMLCVLLLAMMFMANSCGSCSRGIANLTGYDKICIDGVEYLQFPSGVTPAYFPDGRIKTCGK
jgi:hypothetical protein